MRRRMPPRQHRRGLTRRAWPRPLRPPAGAGLAPATAARSARACRSPGRTSRSTCPPPRGSPRGPRRAQPGPQLTSSTPGSRPRPHPTRGSDQRPPLQSCPSRVEGPDFPAASAVLPASRKSAFHRPMDCSLIISRRAASAIVISPTITLNTIRVFFSAEIRGWSSRVSDSPSGPTQLSCHKV